MKDLRRPPAVDTDQPKRWLWRWRPLPPSAMADVVDIAWDTGGRFERTPWPRKFPQNSAASCQRARRCC